MIRIKGLSKSFVSNKGRSVVDVLDEINIDIQTGEFVSILGPNGCGKTTLMNILAKIEEPTRGIVEFIDPFDPKITFVFQNYKPSLLPWKPIWYNIGLPLILDGKSKRTVKREVEELCRRSDLSLPLDELPYNVSGGQAQLSCLLRAVIQRPDILILDEPLSALDYSNYIKLLDNIQKLFLQLRPTILHISHDVDEALYFADRVLIFSDKPSSIKKDLSLNFERPRTPMLITNSEFVAKKNEIIESFYL